MPYTSQAVSFENKRDVGKKKTVHRNTFEYTRLSDGATVYRLHYTDIMTVFKDGTIQLDSGGWKTVTTKDRYNRLLKEYTISSDRGVWYVWRKRPWPAATSSTWKRDERVAFFDGMCLPRDFVPGKDAANIKRQLDLKKKIAAFVNKTLADDKPIPLPNPGDCWCCSMLYQEPANEARGMHKGCAPDSKSDNSHLLSHVNENYMHGWLIVNAMRFAGYGESGIQLHLQGFAGRDLIKRVVKRYLGRKLGLASH